MGSTSSATGTSYVINGGVQGRRRLRVLSSAVTATTGALLARLDVPADGRWLDVGCGGGDVALRIALEHPAATVVGIELDADTVHIARTEAARARAGNVTYRVHDVTRPFPGAGNYDAVYARFVLSHMADPGHVARLMVDAVRPGGVVAVEDVDISGAACSPPSAAFARANELYSALVRSRGADPDIGFRLPGILAAAGLDDVDVAVAQPAGRRGDAKRVQLLTLRNTRSASAAAGLATDAELDDLERDLESFIDRPDTVVTTARIVQSWGTKPAT
ncbi:MAG: methyltransferase domain-containing protein [Ilumatobacteraceae bacterium]